MDNVVAALKFQGIPDGNICVIRLEPRDVLPEQGAGREIKMEAEISLSEVIKRTKDHLGVPNLRIALGRGANMGMKIHALEPVRKFHYAHFFSDVGIDTLLLHCCIFILSLGDMKSTY